MSTVEDLNAAHSAKRLKEILASAANHPGFENDINLMSTAVTFDLAILGSYSAPDMIRILFRTEAGVVGALSITPDQWQMLEQKVNPLLAHHLCAVTPDTLQPTHQEARALNQLWRKTGDPRRWVCQTTGKQNAPKYIRLVTL